MANKTVYRFADDNDKVFLRARATTDRDVEENGSDDVCYNDYADVTLVYTPPDGGTVKILLQSADALALAGALKAILGSESER